MSQNYHYCRLIVSSLAFIIFSFCNDAENIPFPKKELAWAAGKKNLDKKIACLILLSMKYWKGMSEKVLQKIFHSFFTTKPTGREQGLD